MIKIEGIEGKQNGAKFFASLGHGVVLLRRDADFLESSNASDWDIVVRDFATFKDRLEEHFGEPIACVRRPYVIQHYYRWGQVDVLPRFIWRGNEYLDLDRFWANIERRDGEVCRPRLAHDAFLAWMTSILAGGQFNRAHIGLILKAYEKDGDELLYCIQWAFGEEVERELVELLDAGKPERAVEKTQTLRRCVSFGSFFRKPSEWVYRTVNHWGTELKRHIKPPMPSVAFLGPDGSGKSSVIQGVEKSLEKMRMHCRRIHWRPYGLKGREDLGPPVANPHNQPPRGALASTLKLGYFFWDWWSAWLTVLLHCRSKTTVVIMDRFYQDLLIDPRRYRFKGPRWLARVIFKMMPQPDRVFILVGDPEVIWKRKREVPLEEVVRQVEAYRNLAADLGDKASLIDVEQTLEVVVDEVFTDVENEIFLRI